MPKREAWIVQVAQLKEWCYLYPLEHRRLCYMSEVIDIELKTLVFPC